MKKLYLLKTTSTTYYYIVAENPEKAIEKFNNYKKEKSLNCDFKSIKELNIQALIL